VVRASTPLLTAAALVAFASNSLLCRAALAGQAVDAVSFTGIRLASGAVVLWAVAGRPARAGDWRAGTALAVYAFGFSVAYLRIPAGVGALVLFGTVQATLIAAGHAGGERMRAREWAGLALALGGLVLLARPGRTAPDLAGVALMAAAGAAWAVYTLRGRGADEPLRANAANFARTVAFVPPAMLVAAATGGGLAALEVTPRGALLALVSGGVASGLGYAVWYAALRGLSRIRAAVVQLAVAPLAALGGVLLLDERPTLRLAAATLAVLGGVALAVTGGARRA
jgi:drug/metabolite transporter (DMT)-like permease